MAEGMNPEQMRLALAQRYGARFPAIRAKGQIEAQLMGLDIDSLPIQDQFRMYDRILQQDADARNTRPPGR